MQAILLHNHEYSRGRHGFNMSMNAFGDMVSTPAGPLVPSPPPRP